MTHGANAKPSNLTVLALSGADLAQPRTAGDELNAVAFEDGADRQKSGLARVLCLFEAIDGRRRDADRKGQIQPRPVQERARRAYLLDRGVHFDVFTCLMKHFMSITMLTLPRICAVIPSN